MSEWRRNAHTHVSRALDDAFTMDDDKLLSISPSFLEFFSCCVVFLYTDCHDDYYIATRWNLIVYYSLITDVFLDGAGSLRPSGSN